MHFNYLNYKSASCLVLHFNSHFWMSHKPERFTTVAGRVHSDLQSYPEHRCLLHPPGPPRVDVHVRSSWGSPERDCGHWSHHPSSPTYSLIAFLLMCLVLSGMCEAGLRVLATGVYVTPALLLESAVWVKRKTLKMHVRHSQGETHIPTQMKPH